MNEIRRGLRVTDGERHGVVLDVLCQPRRGLNGAVLTDVQVRFDDGVAEWVDPDGLVPETTNESGVKG